MTNRNGQRAEPAVIKDTSGEKLVDYYKAVHPKGQDLMKEFLEHVQKHERDWGNETYKGRPTLDQIFDAKVVSFWLPVNGDTREIIILYKNMDDVEHYLNRMIFMASKFKPDKEFQRAFVDKRMVRIKSTKIVFGFVDDD